MKKIILFGLMLAVLTSIAFAAKSMAGERVILSTTVDDNLMVAAGEVSLSNEVRGDLLCAGGTIMVDSVIEDDLICAGGQLTINKEVKGDVRVAGGDISIGAEIDGDLVVSGGNVRITQSAVIGKDLIVRAGNVLLLGKVARNVDAKAGNIAYGGTAGNNVFLEAQSISFEEGARVGGNLTYASQADVDTTKVDVAGAIFKKVLPKKPPISFAGVYLVGRLLAFVALLVIGLILIAIAPRYTKGVAKNLGSKFWRSLGLGFLILVLTPIAILILMATIIGIPIALITLAIYLIYIYLAKLAAAYWLASKFGDHKGTVALLTFGVALLIIFLVITIPFIGWLVNIVITVAGLGAMVLTCRALFRGMRKRKEL